MEVDEHASEVVGQKKEGEGVRLTNSVYLKHPISLLVLIALTSESSYSAIGQFSIIYDWNESLETQRQRSCA